MEGILELTADPTDGRARLVRFTPGGLAAIHQGLAALVQLEGELADEIGRDRMEDLRQTLLVLDRAL